MAAEGCSERTRPLTQWSLCHRHMPNWSSLRPQASPGLAVKQRCATCSSACFSRQARLGRPVLAFISLLWPLQPHEAHFPARWLRCAWSRCSVVTSRLRRGRNVCIWRVVRQDSQEFGMKPHLEGWRVRFYSEFGFVARGVRFLYWRSQMWLPAGCAASGNWLGLHSARSGVCFRKCGLTLARPAAGSFIRC